VDHLPNLHDGEQDVSRFVVFPEGGISLDAVEDSLIEQALRRSGGNITRAGELLHISRDRVRYRLKANQIRKDDH
jgi:DNA-binding NtrC family response regulator